MRSGHYKAVFSTNALEIGIDVGRLDARILAGFPDNVRSAWQRIDPVKRIWQKTAYVCYRPIRTGASKCCLERLKAQPPFDDRAKRQELSRQLNQIPAVGIERDDIEGRPSIPLATLAQGDGGAKLCRALKWAIQEANHGVGMKGEEPIWKTI